MDASSRLDTHDWMGKNMLATLRLSKGAVSKECCSQSR